MVDGIPAEEETFGINDEDSKDDVVGGIGGSNVCEVNSDDGNEVMGADDDDEDVDVGKGLADVDRACPLPDFEPAKLALAPVAVEHSAGRRRRLESLFLLCVWHL